VHELQFQIARLDSRSPTRFHIWLMSTQTETQLSLLGLTCTLRSGKYLPLGKHLHPSFNHQLFSSFHSHSHTMAHCKRGWAISVSSSTPDGTGISAASSPAPTVENEVSNKKSKFEKQFHEILQSWTTKARHFYWGWAAHINGPIFVGSYSALKKKLIADSLGFLANCLGCHQNFEGQKM